MSRSHKRGCCLVCNDDDLDCPVCGRMALEAADQPELRDLPIDEVLCPTCNVTSIIYTSQPMGGFDLCELNCHHFVALSQDPNHPVNQPLSEDHNSHEDQNMNIPATGYKKACVCCDMISTVWWNDAMGDICLDCRRIFGVTCLADAEMVVALFDKLTPADRLTMLAEEREKAKANTHSSFPLRGRGENRHELPPPRPSVDAAKVAALVRSMIDYGILADDLTTPGRDASDVKPTSFVIAKNGLFELRHTDIADICIQPKVVPGILTEMAVGITLNIPRLPWTFLEQTVALFRETCKRANSSSEALLQVWMDRSEGGGLFIHVPEQKVSGGSVNHTSHFDQNVERLRDDTARYLHVMDIHSHGSSMGGFWSGTDDGDERKAPEGRMFGVIGKVNDPLPDWKWRMRTREGFIDLAVSDIFDTAAEIPFTVTMKALMAAAAEKDGRSEKGHVKLIYPVDPFKAATCPPEWHEQIKVSSHSSVTYHGGHGGIGFHGGGGSRQPSIQLIYIATSDGYLEEIELNGSVRRPTGKKVKIQRQPHTH